METVSQQYERKAIERTNRKLDAVVTLDRAALDWRVKLDPDETREYLSRVESFNNCETGALVDLTKAVDAAIGRVRYPDVDGRPNPNNGRWHHSYEVGNEGSRVLYLEVFRQSSATPGLDYQALTLTCRKAGRRALADENNIDQDDGSYFRWRWWWD